MDKNQIIDAVLTESSMASQKKAENPLLREFWVEYFKKPGGTIWEGGSPMDHYDWLVRKDPKWRAIKRDVEKELWDEDLPKNEGFSKQKVRTIQDEFKRIKKKYRIKSNTDSRMAADNKDLQNEIMKILRAPKASQELEAKLRQKKKWMGAESFSYAIDRLQSQGKLTQMGKPKGKKTKKMTYDSLRNEIAKWHMRGPWRGLPTKDDIKSFLEDHALKKSDGTPDKKAIAYLMKEYGKNKKEV